MSTVELELNSMSNKVEGSPAVPENEREQKVIAGFDELLEQEMKEDDSVDCFIKRVEDAGGDSSEFSLDYEEEASVVTDSALYSSKEETSTDNSSSLLEKELEITLDKEKEEPFKITSDAEKIQSCEGGDTCETPVKNTDVEATDQDTEKEQSVEEETTKERETAEEVEDSSEMKSPSEMQNNDAKETEKDTNSQNSQDENTVGLRKDVLYVVFQPEDQVNDKNDDAQNNENEKTQCKENSAKSGGVNIINPISDKSVPTTVLRITCSSETKTIKEISKPIIIKTARIVKNGSTVTTKTADTFGASGHTSGEDITNTKSTELEEQQHSKSADTKGDGTKKRIHSEDSTISQTVKPKVIFTRKVYGNIKKSTKLLQEKQDSSTKDKDANVGTEDHHSTDDKNADLANGVQISVKTKTLVSNEGKTLSDESATQEEVSDEYVEKREGNFAAVKRKFEDVCRISREEEEATIKEIKKMKKEMLDVLKKINAEMEKLKVIFLAGK